LTVLERAPGQKPGAFFFAIVQFMLRDLLQHKCHEPIRFAAAEIRKVSQTVVNSMDCTGVHADVPAPIGSALACACGDLLRILPRQNAALIVRRAIAVRASRIQSQQGIVLPDRVHAGK
jgi:hypothetical protein